MADGRRAGVLAGHPGMPGGDERVRLTEQPFPAQVGLRVDAQTDAGRRVAEALGTALPTLPNTVAKAGERHVLWLGPDEWLVVEPAGREAATERVIRDALGGDGSAVDLSANRTVLVLAGPAAREVLATCCGLDLHPSAFGPGRCAQTLIAKAQVILQAGDGEIAVYVRPSFAAYVADWLLDGIEGLPATVA